MPRYALTHDVKAAARRNGSSALPRYRQVADELIERIARGVYPVGGLLPTEMELCDHYRISRSTVREALRRLRDAGLISRRRRIGSEVLTRTAPATFHRPAHPVGDLLQYAEDTCVEILSKERVEANRALAELLDCRVGQAWIRIESMRSRPGNRSPICVTTAYVVPRQRGADRNVEALEGSSVAKLERMHGLRIARVEQSVEAVTLPRRQAKLLRAELGSAALRSTRRYYRDDGRLIELSIATHPSDRFTYVTSLVARGIGD
jgi:DNA-binding GntR family transcriptional regulator